MDPAPTVFVVDDDEAMRVSVSRSLRLRRFQVESFETAEHFLESYDPGRPGCLILDYGLPGMNGLDLQEHLIETGRKIPIIFITGHGGIPESVRATKAGAVDFLEKPYKPEVLAARVETALELDRLEREKDALQKGLQDVIDSLTEREREIFELMLRRPEISSAKGVALELDISPRTVEKHRAQVLQKTGCRTVVELIGRFGQMKEW